MANPNGRKGSQFETDVLKWLRSVGYDAERLTKTGQQDEGDIVVKVGGIPFVLELKNEKKINLTDYVRQAETERDNYEKHRDIVPELSPLSAGYAAVAKKRNAPIPDAFVVVPLRESVRHIGTPFRAAAAMPKRTADQGVDR